MFENAKATILSKTARAILLTKKFSPEILVGVGVTSLIGCAVLAHGLKPKAMVIMAEHDLALETIEQVRELDITNELKSEDGYSEKQYKKDKIIQYRNTIVEMGKLYVPTIIVGAIGVTSVLCAFGIIKKRNVALIGAYKLVSKSYDDYRKRVIEKYGEEEDRCFKNGIKKGEATGLTLDENGDAVLTEEDILNPTEFSGYARLFDETNKNWDAIKGYNHLYVWSQEDYANDLLISRGHIFLNEIYDVLGMDRTPEGALVGWVVEEGYERIDFALPKRDTPEAQALAKYGSKTGMMVDFNVQGIVYDKI